MGRMNPTPAEIRKARTDAGLSQVAAARLIHCSMRAWQEWESGRNQMHPAFWELFLQKLESL